MNRCKLDSMDAENYLSALAELSLLTVEDDEEMNCQTTDKGIDFLNTYHRLRWLLWGKENDFLLGTRENGIYRWIASFADERNMISRILSLQDILIVKTKLLCFK